MNQTNKKKVKVAVTGAGGQIGYAFLFRLASGQVFGPEVQIDLNLLEVTPALPSLRGVLMELEDCAFPLLGNVTMTDDENVGMLGVNWAVLIGATPRKAGMERSDLLKINGQIFTRQGKAINQQAASDVKVFVVGNPCNTNCLIAMNSAPDVPRDRFFAMTLLDQNRAQSQLAIKAGVPLTAVKNMIIWGNHSSTQYPDFYHATINGQPVTEVISDKKWLEDEFIPMIQKRGAAVIEARGASSAASAANAIIGSLHALVFDTASDSSYSIASYSQGQYGVDEGLVFSFPTRTRQGQIEIIDGIKHNEFGKQKLQLTLDELRAEYAAVKALGMLAV